MTGRFYAVVPEITVPKWAAFANRRASVHGGARLFANNQKIGPLVESGYREIVTLVEHRSAQIPSITTSPSVIDRLGLRQTPWRTQRFHRPCGAGAQFASAAGRHEALSPSGP